MARRYCAPGDLVLTLLLAGSATLSSAAQSKSLVLNRNTFDGNVKGGKTVDNWFVMFCVDWYKPCQNLHSSFSDHAANYESELNGDAMLSLPVRFAEVDCTVDKVLCNANSVEAYPQVIHYHRGEQVAAWKHGGGKTPQELKRMAKFMQKQTDLSKGRNHAVESELPPGDDRVGLMVLRLFPFIITAVIMVTWATTLALDALEPRQHAGQARKQETPEPAQTPATEGIPPGPRRRQQCSFEL